MHVMPVAVLSGHANSLMGRNPDKMPRTTALQMMSSLPAAWTMSPHKQCYEPACMHLTAVAQQVILLAARMLCIAWPEPSRGD